MKVFIRGAGVFLLLTLSGMVSADEQGYRIAGIIASGMGDWQAIIELPDGEQQLVHEGDFLGQVEIVQISKEGVVLMFPGGVRQMPLTQGGFIPMSVVTATEVSGGSESGVARSSRVVVDEYSKQVDKQRGAEASAPVLSGATEGGAEGRVAIGSGVSASDFSKQVEKQLTSGQVARARGLENLSDLSETARLVSYSYVDDPAGHIPINALNSGVNFLQEAIIDGKELRIKVEGDESFQDIYVMPN